MKNNFISKVLSMPFTVVCSTCGGVGSTKDGTGGWLGEDYKHTDSRVCQTVIESLEKQRLEETQGHNPPSIW